MKKILLLIVLFSVQKLFAQNAVNWTNEQLEQPSELAKTVQANKDVPVIISVGPGAVIPNSIDIGMVKDESNLKKLKTKLRSLPKDAKIVIYCGCCPFEHCPNVRPAIQALKDMKFTNYRLLNLEHNVKTDWIDKGYPTNQ